MLKFRQKLIKIADSSEGGWRTVDEYQRNDLAEDSDDEKRLNRAESRAQKKRRSKDTSAKKKFPRRYVPYQPTGFTGQMSDRVAGGASTSHPESTWSRNSRHFPGKKTWILLRLRESRTLESGMQRGIRRVSIQ